MTWGLSAAVIACAAAAWRLAPRARRGLHLLQLEHYENGRLFRWLRELHELDGRLATVLVIVAAAIGLAAAAAREPVVEVLALVIGAVVLTRHAPPARPERKPLVWTRRARRLYAVTVGVPAALAVAGAALTVALRSDVPLVAAAFALLLCLNLAPWWLTAVNAALEPVQRRINRRFERAARATLAAVHPTVVGITGSYGKTTTKVCVGAVLAQRMPTLITPDSWNSQLGVTRAVNELLEPAHEAFVVEMGMYRRGDIARLCELVHPTIGVLTAIGPVHLERLGSIEAIAAAKAELAHALPAGGTLVANADDERVRAIAREVEVEVVLFGVDRAQATVRAEGIEIVDGRTRFVLRVGEARAEVSAGLLGRHNVSNLLAAAAVGHVLGVGVADIARGLEAVEPPAHRLQPIPNPRAGIVVIDDAYNSNPAGAAAALQVLREHPATRRILVTPGMVELGDEERTLNERFGRQAAAVCDHVILVGPRRTEPIALGLRVGGLDREAITVVRDIAAATETLAGLTRRGDVILFENDLPDMYVEDGTAHAAGSVAQPAAA